MLAQKGQTTLLVSFTEFGLLKEGQLSVDLFTNTQINYIIAQIKDLILAQIVADALSLFERLVNGKICV